MGSNGFQPATISATEKRILTWGHPTLEDLTNKTMWCSTKHEGYVTGHNRNSAFKIGCSCQALGLKPQNMDMRLSRNIFLRHDNQP